MSRGSSGPPFFGHLREQGRAGECAGFITALDKAVRDAGVGDRQARPIPGFPYLRVDRFLASFAGQNLPEPALRSWVERLAVLNLQARKAEIANLPAPVRRNLQRDFKTQVLLQSSAECGELLRAIDLAVPENLALLRKGARVEPDYSTFSSLLGLYPLTSLFVRIGIVNYHRGILRTYLTGLDQLPVAGRLVRYVPPAAKGPAPVRGGIPGTGISADPLGIPIWSATELQHLFRVYAPIWEVDATGEYDRIGTPAFADHGLPSVDPARPQVFTLLSYTLFQGEILPQLNYVAWFSARPRQGRFDLYGGRLDGLIWRVTLDRHGRPLLYDTIHSCGCYHMFFPDPARLAPRPQSVFAEPLLLPPQADLFVGRRLVLRVASRTHYIDRVYAEKRGSGGAGITYAFADYNGLRSLPAGAAGRRSLFGPDGLVPGTERGERFLLWPTGVLSPGAMRQWGNHATAFMGRRHFDDSGLLEKLFQPVR